MHVPFRLLFSFLVLSAVWLSGCQQAAVVTAPVVPFQPDSTLTTPDILAQADVPEWTQDVVWYQIFPERFRNGDSANDPIRASIEFPERAPETWAITPWTADWYARADWEREMGGDFYDSVFHRRLGGDLQGVIDQLDYLQDLGVTGLYFNPVFYARSLHKYDGNTFHHIDPYFGPDPEGDLTLMASEAPTDPATWHWTRADSLFLHVLDEAHRRDMRIVIDGVFNHTGRDFFAFDDLWAKQQDSPYKDWYIINAFDDPETPEDEFAYKGWWGAAALPEFADTPDGADLHPGPKQYVFDATRRWMDPNADGDPADGIDGWRLDVAEEVPTQFWQDWNRLVRELNPEAYTVAEIWTEADSFIAESGFSAAMNYYGFALPVKAFLVDGRMKASVFTAMLDLRRQVHSPSVLYAMQNLVDSHDTDRIASMIVNADRPYVEPAVFDYDRNNSPRNNADYALRAPNETDRKIQRLIALFQVGYVGAPMLYYGTEAGMWGADDPDDRMPMVWPDLDYAPQYLLPDSTLRATPEPVLFDSTLFAFYQSTINFRKQHEALRQGRYTLLTVDDATQTFAFQRSGPTQHFMLVFNRSTDAQTVPIPWSKLGAGADARLDIQGKEYAPVLVSSGSPNDVRVRSESGQLLIDLPALTGAILAPTWTFSRAP